MSDFPADQGLREEYRHFHPEDRRRESHVGLQDHNNTLSGLQGGSVGERYHLSAVQHSGLTGAGETALHTHRHNAMVFQQGGDTTERYHLTEAQHTGLTGGAETDLHRHVARYGEMFADNVVQAITIATANTWTDIPAGLSAGASNAFTFQNSKELRCDVAGKYAAFWSLSLQTTGANDDVEAAIGINGTVVGKTKSHQSIAIPNQEFHLSSQGVLTLAVNDLVRLMVNNNTDDDDLEMEHANLFLMKLHD